MRRTVICGELYCRLHIYNGEAYADMDLRVGVHDTASEELRRVHSVYKPHIPYYEPRHRDPQNTPPQHQWLREMQARMQDDGWIIARSYRGNKAKGVSQHPPGAQS
jgi:hypothetical protein